MLPTHPKGAPTGKKDRQDAPPAPLGVPLGAILGARMVPRTRPKGGSRKKIPIFRCPWNPRGGPKSSRRPTDAPRRLETPILVPKLFPKSSRRLSENRSRIDAILWAYFDAFVVYFLDSFPVFFFAHLNVFFLSIAFPLTQEYIEI